MPTRQLAERIQRPLIGAVALVLAVGVATVAFGPDGGRIEGIRAGLGVGTDAEGSPGDDAVESSDVVAGATGPEGAATPGVLPADPSAPALGPASVPAAGTYRYQVETTIDARSTVQEELREVVVLAGDRSTGTVQISARLADESQVSVIDWSPVGALVRSTRIESDAGSGRDCTWAPPFAELGSLGAGATWSVDSTCQTPVGGIDTTFRLTGEGRVVGEAVATLGDEQVRVWEIRRDRTTDIRATFGDQTLVQQAREEGTLFFDPARGVVIRSDVTVTLSGSQTGVTRRVSALIGESVG